ncbi:hypothetical protein [Mesorhizobium sp.]|uniref:hypothetical protein n=1 Tax=Mesorhizobium sp. TaxID=1871066 RepID=UPI003458F2F9
MPDPEPAGANRLALFPARLAGNIVQTDAAGATARHLKDRVVRIGACLCDALRDTYAR